NEVIAHLANEQLGEPGAVHPNDHANMGQSSNDTFPTAMHIAGAMALETELTPALERLAASLAARVTECEHIGKIGRTHLMDATPIRMGQVFSGYAAQAHYSLVRVGRSKMRLLENMPVGGTAVGTGINTHPEFARRV